VVWTQGRDTVNICAYFGGGNADKIKRVSACPPRSTTEVGVSHLNRTCIHKAERHANKSARKKEKTSGWEKSLSNLVEKSNLALCLTAVQGQNKQAAEAFSLRTTRHEPLLPINLWG